MPLCVQAAAAAEPKRTAAPGGAVARSPGPADSSGDKSKLSVILGTVIGSVVAFVIVGAIIGLCCYQRRRRGKATAKQKAKDKAIVSGTTANGGTDTIASTIDGHMSRAGQANTEMVVRHLTTACMPVPTSSAPQRCTHYSNTQLLQCAAAAVPLKL